MFTIGVMEFLGVPQFDLFLVPKEESPRTIVGEAIVLEGDILPLRSDGFMIISFVRKIFFNLKMFGEQGSLSCMIAIIE